MVENVSKVCFRTILLLNQADKLIEPPQPIGSIGFPKPGALK